MVWIWLLKINKRLCAKSNVKLKRQPKFFQFTYKLQQYLLILHELTQHGKAEHSLYTVLNMHIKECRDSNDDRNILEFGYNKAFRCDSIINKWRKKYFQRALHRCRMKLSEAHQRSNGCTTRPLIANTYFTLTISGAVENIKAISLLTFPTDAQHSFRTFQFWLKRRGKTSAAHYRVTGFQANMQIENMRCKM